MRIPGIRIRPDPRLISLPSSGPAGIRRKTHACAALPAPGMRSCYVFFSGSPAPSREYTAGQVQRETQSGTRPRWRLFIANPQCRPGITPINRFPKLTRPPPLSYGADACGRLAGFLSSRDAGFFYAVSPVPEWRSAAACTARGRAGRAGRPRCGPCRPRPPWRIS